MNDSPHTNDSADMKDAILRKIHAHQLTMRPKVYFTLEIALATIVMIAILVISIFIVNFLAFSIRINSRDVLLSFGPRGIIAFLVFFPWALLVIDAALIVVLEMLLRRFRFGYRHPAIYLLFGLFALSLLVGVFLDRGTRLNDALSQKHVPPFMDIYGSARRMPPLGSGLCKCTITAIAGNMLTVQDARATTTMRIILPPNDARATTSALRVGDTVFIAGDIDEGGVIIHAFGVRKLPPDALPGSLPAAPLEMK